MEAVIEVQKKAGLDLAEQLATWLEENDWGDLAVVSLTPDFDVATVELGFPQFDSETTRKILNNYMTRGLSDDFELVKRKALKRNDGRIGWVVFTVKGRN